MNHGVIFWTGGEGENPSTWRVSPSWLLGDCVTPRLLRVTARRGYNKVRCWHGSPVRVPGGKRTNTRTRIHIKKLLYCPFAPVDCFLLLNMGFDVGNDETENEDDVSVASYKLLLSESQGDLLDGRRGREPPNLEV